MWLKSDSGGKANAMFLNLLSHTRVVKNAAHLAIAHFLKMKRGGGTWKYVQIMSDIEIYLLRL